MSVSNRISRCRRLFLLLLASRYTTKAILHNECRETDHGVCEEKAEYFLPPDCTLVMAKSTVNGFGIYSLFDRRRGAQILPGDIVIQLPDVIHQDGMKYFQENYWTSSHDTGGMFEGKEVHSITPGIGMLTNSVYRDSNILPYRVDRDDGSCSRENCKGSGSFTQYHNYTWFFHKDISAGQELLSPKPDDWFQQRGLNSDDYTNPKNSRDTENPPSSSLKWLRQNGLCLDNIIPSESSVSGRGAFAARFLPLGTIVAPVPVLPIFDWRKSLNMLQEDKGSSTKQRWQLLLNYCFGHSESSLLLFPYGPFVNLINHSEKPNVQLRFSKRFNHEEWLQISVQKLQNVVNESGLVLELVALRDISPNEEIFLDYGQEWKSAWERHNYPIAKSMDGKPPYTPAHVMDEVATKVRTATEQSNFPYPANVQTSCFYEYQNGTKSTTDDIKQTVTTVQWNWTRRVFEWTNLRPCSILHRSADDAYYTVQIKNRHGSPSIPNRHLVSKVPRPAIRFTDRIYTTDQHLPYAFRHWIGLANEILPNAWKDL
jgi:SET domain